MLDSIRSVAKGWVGKAILALITIPFALFGIDSYLSDAGNNVAIAKVDGSEITVQAYSNAMQNLRTRMQNEGKVDQAQLDSPEVKAMVLDQLINEQLLEKEIQQANYKISDAHLATYITAMPSFQKDGKFSQELYDELLQQNRYTPKKFEAEIRATLLSQQAQDGIAKLGFISTARADKTLKLLNQKRLVTVSELKTKDFLDQVKVDPAEVKAYYEKHKDKLRDPEQVKIEFLLLSASSLVPGIKVDDADVKRYYDENAAKFQGNEQRRASHILIGFGVNATPEQKQEAKDKAQTLLATIKKNPKSFEELAIKNSQDPGSATKGGDLGSFGRGAMVKPFEEAAFSMKVNEVSDLVESEFGYHIIKLTEISGQSSDFESLKPQIKGELIFQKAQAEFVEKAESFSNSVYEQSDSLAPTAKAFGGQVQLSGWMSREDAAKFFKSDKIVGLIFAQESLKERRNTEAVEVSPNNLVSARVLEYKPSAAKTFDAVSAGIEDLLKLEAAAKLAVTKGEAALKTLRAGGNVDSLDWIPEVMVDRKNAQGLTQLAMTQVFKTDVTKLPAYSGLADSKLGYMIVKVVEVDTSSIADAESVSTAKAELNQVLSDEYLAAYKQSLREKVKVTVNQRLLLENTNN
ncbi:SurA N-terminal domain-containing protein [Methylotenera sp.]|jgi:peptidyl-prolyl cis-trans isomerase D|uniref:SurA N-terminal domain-containing protein n=1 Tax=Methylotenera sp. TaxID=2051956 RepID=UPI002734D724|nr:SurA N-terminal domain-containing protein [Methylotenera sp.]MDP3776726.1 SurA N-terminal domain-containing protein [Methylotenera sp.]